MIVLNVHLSSEGKIDDSNDSFYEELVQLFKNFPKYHRKFYKDILTQKWRERIFYNRKLGMRVYIRRVMIVVLE